MNNVYQPFVIAGLIKKKSVEIFKRYEKMRFRKPSCKMVLKVVLIDSLNGALFENRGASKILYAIISKTSRMTEDAPYTS